MSWIDTHVHIFAGDKSSNENVPLLFDNQALNTADEYLENLGDNKPEGVVVVDFSKSKNSEHVVDSLDELKDKGIKAAGVIKADINEPRTEQWLDRDDVKGIRFYAIAGVPDLSEKADEWQKIFDKIKATGKHILAFGKGQNLVDLVNQIPEDITILVDHLGMPDISSGEANGPFNEILDIAKQRGNIFFKGPGYRTSLDVEKVKPVLKKIADSVGVDRLILGASDGPFAGPSPEFEGKMIGEFMNYSTVIDFTQKLASVATNDDNEKEKIFFGNAKKIYGF